MRLYSGFLYIVGVAEGAVAFVSCRFIPYDGVGEGFAG